MLIITENPMTYDGGRTYVHVFNFNNYRTIRYMEYEDKHLLILCDDDLWYELHTYESIEEVETEVNYIIDAFERGLSVYRIGVQDKSIQIIKSNTIYIDGIKGDETNGSER